MTIKSKFAALAAPLLFVLALTGTAAAQDRAPSAPRPAVTNQVRTTPSQHRVASEHVPAGHTRVVTHRSETRHHGAAAAAGSAHKR